VTRAGEGRARAAATATAPEPGPIVRPGVPERTTVLQGNRRKAYRPIDATARREAFEAGLLAYEQGYFFAAHELLEPAWMGTDNAAERALYQGLIKLAAGYVHCVRGNPLGMAKNLEGALAHLAASERLDPRSGLVLGLDVPALLAQVEQRLATARSAADDREVDRSAMLDLAEDAPPLR
jgi:predicted metal-dependent hydrolase